MDAPQEFQIHNDYVNQPFGFRPSLSINPRSTTDFPQRMLSQGRSAFTSSDSNLVAYVNDAPAERAHDSPTYTSVGFSNELGGNGGLGSWTASSNRDANVDINDSSLQYSPYNPGDAQVDQWYGSTYVCPQGTSAAQQFFSTNVGAGLDADSCTFFLQDGPQDDLPLHWDSKNVMVYNVNPGFNNFEPSPVSTSLPDLRDQYGQVLGDSIHVNDDSASFGVYWENYGAEFISNTDVEHPGDSEGFAIRDIATATNSSTVHGKIADRPLLTFHTAQFSTTSKRTMPWIATKTRAGGRGRFVGAAMIAMSQHYGGLTSPNTSVLYI
ncbi:uncharacterized protein FIBRA_06507 [Fibroporia radiculosa]|uniref:Uncharacterized protein n=1 Tax=Fibroporia radiculosa TaxID=599839 RepID=J4GSV5_9APHY|nr:uncharacterized protein FIBRA_06507 [Fibroporia radiculosa]CCM04335.1 predicted protein [Fibroporia radiculosa]